MSQKHSQKMGAGSDFYRSQVGRRGTEGGDRRHCPVAARPSDRNPFVRSRFVGCQAPAPPPGRAASCAARPVPDSEATVA